MKRVQLKWKWCQGAILKIEDAALGLPYLICLLLCLSHHPRFECSDQREACKFQNLTSLSEAPERHPWLSGPNLLSGALAY